MDLVTTPLPADVEYTLDAALEHGELDAAAHLTLKMYAPRADLMRLVDHEWELGPETLHPRLALCARLTVLADDIMQQLPIARRGAIAMAGVQHVKHEVRSLAWCLATWAIEDEIKGGCMQPFKPWSRWVDRYELTPRQRRKLYAPAWIRRTTKANDDSRRMRAYGSRTLARLTGVAIGAHEMRRAADALWSDLQAQHEGYRRTNEHAIRNMVMASRTPSAPSRARRKVIKRALACAESVLPRSVVADFTSGRPVRLQGQTLSLEVSRLGSSADLGHGAMSIIAVDPVHYRQLASLCVYHEKTPALDQVTALALAMQAGEEAEIIATANLSNVTDLGMDHPLIAERGKARREPQWRPRDERAEKNEAYWQATKPVWIESLGVFTLGRLWSVVA